MSEEDIVAAYPWLMSKARTFCSNYDDANDLAEETVYKVLTNRDKYDRNKPFKAWMLAIMHNTFVTMSRRSSFFDNSAYVEDEQICELTSHELLEFKELLLVLKRLNAKSNSVECMIYFAKGYTYCEISKILGIPIGTVMSRIHIARKLLKDELCK